MASSILNFILVLLEVILLFNLIIIVHELGHFLAARWRGLHVEGFGIWFGKPIWQKKINGVVYSLGSIPAGGFVKLPQLAPMEAIEGQSEVPREELPPIKPLDKIIVAFAGPLFSFLFAIVLACVVWGVGKPVNEALTTTVIGYIEPSSPAEEAGLKPGDRIVAVDGNPVEGFHGMNASVMWYIIRSEGEKIVFDIERDGKPFQIKSGWTRPPTKGWQRQGLRRVGIGPAYHSYIDDVRKSGPAEKAGLQKNDIITHVNGQAIYGPGTLAETIKSAPTQPVELTLQRGDTLLQLSVTPEKTPEEVIAKATKKGQSVPEFGIGITYGVGPLQLIHPSPLQQVKDSVATIGRMLNALFSSKSDVKAQHFSGPVGIGNMYYQMLTADEGWRLALWFSVFFNVNLALLNLLPLPVLDGGHITLALIESIRRKQVNIRVLEFIQTGCALFIIGYMLYVTFFDIQDLPWHRLGLGKPVAEQVE